MQQNLVGDFDLQWEQLIKKSLGGLDPDGELNLEKEFRDYLQKNPNQRSDTQQKYNKALKDDLPKVLEEVGQALVTEQTGVLVKQLEKAIAEGLPKAVQIESANAGGAVREIQALTSAVLERTDKDVLQVLLEGAVDALEAEETKVFEDGVKQLEEQEAVFDKAPTALSLPGLQWELKATIDKVAEGQEVNRKQDALRPSYGVFPSVEQKIPVQVASRFDARLAEQVQQFQQQVNKQGVGDQERGDMRKLILADPRRHHTRDQSVREARALFDKIVGVRQATFFDQLVSQLPNSQIQADREIAEDDFRNDVTTQFAQPGSTCGKAWDGLDARISELLDFSLRTEVRPAIAEEQQTEYAAPLMNGTWRPKEDKAIAWPDNATEDALRKLSFWSKAPPSIKADLLEETWQKWMELASAEIATCRKAMDDQEQIVEGLEPRVQYTMGKEGSKYSREQWERSYGELVLAQWQQSEGERSQRYPALFDNTKKRISEIVAKLLESLEKKAPNKKVMVQPDQPKPEPDPDPAEPKIEVPRQQEPNPRAGQVGPGPGPGKGGEGGENVGDGPDDQKKNDGPGAGEGGGGGGGKGKGPGGGEEEKAKKSAKKKEVAEEDEPLELDGGGLRMYTFDFSELDSQANKVSWFYVIAFWVLLAIILLMAIGWYLHVRSLKRQIAQLLGVLSPASR